MRQHERACSSLHGLERGGGNSLQTYFVIWTTGLRLQMFAVFLSFFALLALFFFLTFELGHLFFGHLIVLA